MGFLSKITFSTSRQGKIARSNGQKFSKDCSIVTLLSPSRRGLNFREFSPADRAQSRDWAEHHCTTDLAGQNCRRTRAIRADGTLSHLYLLFLHLIDWHCAHSAPLQALLRQAKKSRGKEEKVSVPGMYQKKWRKWACVDRKKVVDVGGENRLWGGFG